MVVNGTVVDTVTADLAANGTTAVNATHTFESAGMHELCVGGTCTSVAVVEETDGSGDSTDAGDGANGDGGTDDSLPGFGALGTLFAIALLVTTGILRRE